MCLASMSQLTGKKKTHHPFRFPYGIVYSAEGKAEIIANSMQEQFIVHRAVCNPDHSAVDTDFISGCFSHPPADSLAPSDRTDVVSPLVGFAPSGHPARIVSVRHSLSMLPSSHLTGFKLFDGCLQFHYFPSLWEDRLDP